MNNILKCECGATARATGKERGRFLRRHMENCQKAKRAAISKEFAAGVRSVSADAPTDFEGRQV